MTMKQTDSRLRVGVSSLFEDAEIPLRWERHSIVEIERSMSAAEACVIVLLSAILVIVMYVVVTL